MMIGTSRWLCMKMLRPIRCHYCCPHRGFGVSVATTTTTTRPTLRIGQQEQFQTNWYRSYFTNGKHTKKNDPYAILGLQWGEGVTTSEIKTAFRQKAKELHPDVYSRHNDDDKKHVSPKQALEQFQQLQKAYETLVKNLSFDGEDNGMEAWRVAVWRRSDRIALDRTDVAGIKRKRPVPPASSKVYARELGHPQGVPSSTGEYLGTGTATHSTRRQRRKSSSVGSGQSKWVKPKAFSAWNGTRRRS